MSVAILTPVDAIARIEVKSRLLEDLLEALAKTTFPIDPQLEHNLLAGTSIVEFDIASEHIADLQDVLHACGLTSSSLSVRKRILNDGAPAVPIDTPSEWAV